MAVTIKAASGVGRVVGPIGGLHGFNDFYLIKDLEHLCTGHCQRRIEAIRRRCPNQYMAAGAGRIIEL